MGANAETVANLDHKASGPRVRILLQSQHKSTGIILKTQWPHFWLLQSMTCFSFFFFSLDCTLLVHDCTCRWLLLWVFSAALKLNSQVLFQYLFRLTVIYSWNLKVSIFKQANSQCYQRNWKMGTTQSSCIQVWMLKCFKLFYLINLVTTSKWSKTHSIIVMATCLTFSSNWNLWGR